jgi:tyrosine-protein phosphatase SIW14
LATDLKRNSSYLLRDLKINKSMSIQVHRWGLAVLALALSLPASPAHVETTGKVPSIIAVPGIPNFHQVNDHIFRGGQPATEAWPSLARLGVKSVIDLRREDEHSTAAEAQAVAAAGMSYYNVPMKGVVEPTNEQIAKILTLLNSQDPVFVHCKRGADRTGTVIACYRIAHDRWERKQALNEAKSFGMAWDQMGLKHYVMIFKPAL